MTAQRQIAVRTMIVLSMLATLIHSTPLADEITSLRMQQTNNPNIINVSGLLRINPYNKCSIEVREKIRFYCHSKCNSPNNEKYTVHTNTIFTGQETPEQFDTKQIAMHTEQSSEVIQDQLYRFAIECCKGFMGCKLNDIKNEITQQCNSGSLCRSQEWKNMCDEERIDALRVQATSMNRRDKILRIALIFAEQFKHPLMDCRLLRKKSKCDCRTVKMCKPSFIDSLAKLYINDIQPVKCHVEIQMAKLQSRNDTQLNMIVYALLECEILSILLQTTNDPSIVQLLRKHLERLIKALNYIRCLSTKLSPDDVDNAFRINLNQIILDYDEINKNGPSVRKAFTRYLVLQTEADEETFNKTIFRLGKIFLFYLDHYDLKIPTKFVFKKNSDKMLYEEAFYFWLEACKLPSIFRSFARRSISDMFGFEQFRLIFADLCEFINRSVCLHFQDKSAVNFKYADMLSVSFLLPGFLLNMKKNFAYEKFAAIWQTECEITTEEGKKVGVRALVTDLERFTHTNQWNHFQEIDLEIAHLMQPRYKPGADDVLSNISVDSEATIVGNDSDENCVIDPDDSGFCYTHYSLNKAQRMIIEERCFDKIVAPSDKDCIRTRLELEEKIPQIEPSKEDIESVTAQVASTILGDIPTTVDRYLMFGDTEESFKQELEQSCKEVIESRKEFAPENRSSNAAEHVHKTLEAWENESGTFAGKNVYFKFLQNTLKPPTDLTRQDMIFLLQLQHVYGQQLPRMGGEYITKLIFDTRHISLALIKDKKRVIGGITFRPFKHRRFSEIVFCAISSTEQVKGYGTMLMSFLKDYHISKGILFFLTFADEHAIGYFRKQGFSTEFQLQESDYSGYIKEYEGATLMECFINPLIIYSELVPQIRLQKAILANIINRRKKIDQIKPVYFDFSKKKVLSIADLQRVNYNCINWNLERMEEDLDCDDYAHVLKGPLTRIVETMRKHNLGNKFYEFKLPNQDARLPDGSRAIYHIDLKMISKKIQQDYYRHFRMFHADMSRIFNNIRICYDENDPFSKNSHTMERYYIGLAQHFELMELELENDKKTDLDMDDDDLYYDEHDETSQEGSSDEDNSQDEDDDNDDGDSDDEFAWMGDFGSDYELDDDQDVSESSTFYEDWLREVNSTSVNKSVG